MEKAIDRVRAFEYTVSMNTNNMTWRQRRQHAKVEKIKEIIYFIIGMAALLLGYGIAGSGTYPY